MVAGRDVAAEFIVSADICVAADRLGSIVCCLGGICVAADRRGSRVYCLGRLLCGG